MSAFRYPAGQKFECRDCPSKCCSMPWKTVIQTDEKNRLEKIPWISKRLSQAGAIFEPHGNGNYALPMVERARRIECLFLDPDGLCSIHRAVGHESIPLSCQLFPFDFLEDPTGQIHVSMSRLCPSIEDSYGNPVESILPSRFQSNGKQGRKICDTMDLGFQTALPYSQYTAITDQWIEILKSPGSIRQKLRSMHQMTSILQKKIEAEKSVPDSLFQEAINEAKSKIDSSLPPPINGGLIGRILIALALHRIAYPVRVIRSAKFSLKESMIRAAMVIKLVRGRGSVDLLYTSGMTDLEKLKTVSSGIQQPDVQDRLTRYFREVISRKNIFEERRHLMEILFRFALAYTTMIRFAQIRALSRGVESADTTDYREAIGIAEFSFLYHPLQSSETNDPWIKNVMEITAQNELSFEKILFFHPDEN